MYLFSKFRQQSVIKPNCLLRRLTGAHVPIVCYVASVFAVVSFAGGMGAQQPVVQPPAVIQVTSILAGSLTAMSGGSPTASDVALIGTVAVITVSQGVQGISQTVQGTVRMVSNASGMTRVEINSTSGNQVETRRVSATPQAGESQFGSGPVSSLPLHNLLVDPGWFFPEHLVSRAITSTRPVTVVPAAAMDGTMAIGVDSYLTPTSSFHSETMKQLSETTIFLDQMTLLPVELQYNDHAVDSLLKILPTRVVYSNYQAVQGHMVPFHIQQYVKGTLHEDITITGAVLNPGIATSEYSLN